MVRTNKSNLSMVKEKKDGAQAINRALAILLSFDLTKPTWKAIELSERLGLTLPTTKRILKALESEGLLIQNNETSAYELGLRVFELGMVASSRILLLNQSKEVLVKLREETNETVHLVIVDGDDILYIKKMESSDVFGVTSPDGLRRPMATGSLGKAILSTYSQTMLEAHLSRNALTTYTPRSIIDPKIYRKELARVKERGFAIDQEELITGVCGVAAPIAEGKNPAIGGIAIAFPSIHFDKETVDRWGQLARQSGLTIAQQIAMAKKGH